MNPLGGLETLSDFGAAVACLFFAASLLRQAPPQRMHKRLAWLLLCLALGLFSRGFKMSYQMESGSLANQVELFGLSLFPLFATLFVEDALRRSVPRWLKGTIILGSLFFSVSSLTPIAAEGWRLLSTMAYHLLVVGYLAFMLLFGAVRVGPGPRRSLLSALCLVAFCCLPSIVTDYRHVLGFEARRLGSWSVLVLVYLASNALHARARYRLIHSVLRLLGVCALLGICGVISTIVSPSLLQDALVVMGTTALTLYLASEPLRSSARRSAKDQELPLVDRLSRIQANDFRGFKLSLEHWPELKGIEVLSAEELRADGYDSLPAHFEAHSSLQHADHVRVVAASSIERVRFPAEQLLDVMKRKGFDFCCALGTNGDLLGISTQGVLEIEVYHRALQPAATVANLLYTRESS